MWGKMLRRAVRRREDYSETSKGGRAGLAFAALLVAPGSLTAGPAVGQFEIKSLDAVPGRIEFQSQNAYTLGNPRRAVVEDDDEIEGDDNSVSRARAALELEYSVTRYFKTRIGIEYEKERIDDAASLGEVDDFDRLRLDEYAFEGILILVPRPKQGFALGAVVEYELPFERGGARTLNYGPIIEWVSGPWLATFNPTLIQFFGGETNEDGTHDDKTDFGYTARVLYRASDTLALAIESYGTVERVGGTGHPSEEALKFGDFNQHRVGPVAYFSFEPGDAYELRQGHETEVTLGLGAFAGLNENTPDATLKLSLEVEF
jgi:hypothetical protein